MNDIPFVSEFNDRYNRYLSLNEEYRETLDMISNLYFETNTERYRMLKEQLEKTSLELQIVGKELEDFLRRAGLDKNIIKVVIYGEC